MPKIKNQWFSKNNSVAIISPFPKNLWDFPKSYTTKILTSLAAWLFFFLVVTGPSFSFNRIGVLAQLPVFVRSLERSKDKKLYYKTNTFQPMAFLHQGHRCSLHQMTNKIVVVVDKLKSRCVAGVLIQSFLAIWEHVTRSREFPKVSKSKRLHNWRKQIIHYLILGFFVRHYGGCRNTEHLVN